MIELAAIKAYEVFKKRFKEMRLQQWKKPLLSLLFMFLGTMFLSSCSVYMAAIPRGIDLDKISKCKKRACIAAHGAVPMSEKKSSTGKIIEEVYKVNKPTGSATRAAMHGLLDVATLGLWEIAGTPIEGILGKEEFYIITVTYQEDGETVKTVIINN